MKVVLLGYGEMAAGLAKGVLNSNHELVGVFRWDRVKKSPMKLALKDFFFNDNFYSLIKEHKIHEITAKSANGEDFAEQIKKLNPDVLLVGSWGEVLKTDIIQLPKVASINCHPSLLPKYRGANPYFHTIKNGELKSGVTFHLINEKLDQGDILMQKIIPITQIDNGRTLRSKTAYEACLMVMDLLDKLEKGEIEPTPQNEEDASYYPPPGPDDAIIDWSVFAKHIYNQIRASQPWFNCYTRYGSEIVEVKEAKAIAMRNEGIPYGTILNNDKSGILVATGDPQKAILITKANFYGFLSDIWGQSALSKIKVGDKFE